MSQAGKRKSENTQSTGSGTATIDELDPGLLNHLLGYQLRRAQGAVFQHFARTLSHREITPGQLGLLVLIARNPGVSQTRLAREVGVERSTLGEFIDRFVAKELVERRQVPTDRRMYAIHLTPDGERFLEEITPEISAHERDFAKSLSRAERQTLMQLLKRLVMPE